MKEFSFIPEEKFIEMIWRVQETMAAILGHSLQKNEPALTAICLRTPKGKYYLRMVRRGNIFLPCPKVFRENLDNLRSHKGLAPVYCSEAGNVLIRKPKVGTILINHDGHYTDLFMAGGYRRERQEQGVAVGLAFALGLATEEEACWSVAENDAHDISRLIDRLNERRPE